MSKARAVLQVSLPINRPRKLFLFASFTIFPSLPPLLELHPPYPCPPPPDPSVMLPEIGRFIMI